MSSTPTSPVQLARDRRDKSSTLSFVAAALLLFALTRVVAVIGAWIALGPLPGRLHLLAYNWDGHWYQDIASHGYDTAGDLGPDLRVLCERPGEAGCVEGATDRYPNLAFFPLFVWLIRVTMAMGINPIHGAILITVLASFTAAALIALIARDVAGPRFALIAVVLWGSWPVNIVLSIGRPESLFVALTAGGLLLVMRGRYTWAALVCVLAGLTRFQAVALVAAVVGAAWWDGWHRRKFGQSLLVTAVAPLGLAAQLAFVGSRTGTLGGWFDVQRAWTSVSDWGFAKAQYVWENILGGEVIHQVAAWTIVAACILFVAGVWLRLPWVLSVYAGILLLGVLVQTPYHQHSMRFLLVAFPLVFPLAWAMRRWSGWVLAVVLFSAALASAAFQLVLLRGPVSF